MTQPRFDDRAFQFARNGRWGTCADCPRDSHVHAYPEFCVYTARGDHQLTLEALARLRTIEAAPANSDDSYERPDLVADAEPFTKARRELELRVSCSDKSRGYDNWPRISQEGAQALLDRLDGYEQALAEIASNGTYEQPLCENVCGCQFKAKEALRGR